MKNNLKQLLISGYLGDGSIYEKGVAMYTSVHKEYMEFKRNLVKDSSSSISSRLNSGYKKTSNITTLHLNMSESIKEFYKLPIEEKVKGIDELGLALWFYDDGSRHKTANFFNINTHSLGRDDEEVILIPLLNSFNIFPKILTETKKDGRVFSYLYVSKWRGAMEMSRLMRKLDIPCYNYKLVPKEIEDAYFKLKDTKEFVNATTRRKTNIIKDYLNIEHSNFLGNQFNTSEYLNSDLL